MDLTPWRRSVWVLGEGWGEGWGVFVYVHFCVSVSVCVSAHPSLPRVRWGCVHECVPLVCRPLSASSRLKFAPNYNMPLETKSFSHWTKVFFLLHTVLTRKSCLLVKVLNISVIFAYKNMARIYISVCGETFYSRANFIIISLHIR